ncbi:hypothetical protein [Streptococcus hyovaginalis]|uniref:hypothetical protein n=1 Tax=Streptococcus hyovaginalis TaxID=149015 RepID=UPI001479545A|nr:hypothetical protein [Streptococcus hyovaginalis]
MGLFNWFKRNDKVEAKTKIVTSNNLKWDSFPPLEKYRVNPTGKRYDDSYITGTPYKLRELLLLVWWGRTKNPRNPNSKPPRYFMYDYHLNTKQVTDMFVTDGLLEKDEKNRTVLTEIGKNFYNKFEVLWEIHSYKGFLGELPNMDKEFYNWDYNSYKANNNLFEVRHLEAIIDYNTKMASQYPKNSDQFKAYMQDVEQDKEQIVFLLDEYNQLTNKQ